MILRLVFKSILMSFLMLTFYNANSQNKESKNELIEELFIQIEFDKNINRVINTFYKIPLTEDEWEKYKIKAKVLSLDLKKKIKVIYYQNYDTIALRKLIKDYLNDNDLFAENTKKINANIYTLTEKFINDLEIIQKNVSQELD